MPGARGIFHPQGKAGLSVRLTEKLIIFLYFLSYYSSRSFILVSKSIYSIYLGHVPQFGGVADNTKKIKMCTIKFSIELITVQIDDKGLNTNNICRKKKKSEQIF